jgi:hypothetical protein
VNTYERRQGGEIVERVTNIRPGTPRDRELAALIVIDSRRTRDGWYLVGVDGDDGSGLPAPDDDQVDRLAGDRPDTTPAPVAVPHKSGEIDHGEDAQGTGTGE